jgi:hypothetical protein
VFSIVPLRSDPPRSKCSGSKRYGVNIRKRRFEALKASCAWLPTSRQPHSSARAQRALALKSYSYRAIRTLIETPITPPTQPALDLAHDNVRGPEYFQ